ncbi:hypothetical protein Q7P36_004409 [Cladosporium allicinum]
MSNRPFSFDSKVQAEEPVVMGLFSKAAAPSCCEPSQSRVDPRLQNVSDAIDEALLSIASEGFVLSATETEIPEVLKEIRKTGCLEAAPLEDQPKLSIDCVLPRPVFCDSQKVWRCGKARAQSAKVAPSAAWASLGGAKYDFVDGRKIPKIHRATMSEPQDSSTSSSTTKAKFLTNLLVSIFLGIAFLAVAVTLVVRY